MNNWQGHAMRNCSNCGEDFYGSGCKKCERSEKDELKKIIYQDCRLCNNKGLISIEVKNILGKTVSVRCNCELGYASSLINVVMYQQNMVLRKKTLTKYD